MDMRNDGWRGPGVSRDSDRKESLSRMSRAVVGHAEGLCKAVKLTSLKWMAPLVTGAVAVAWAGVLVDFAARDDWEGISRTGHVLASLLLYTTAGTILGLGAAAVVAGHRAAERRVGTRWPSWGPRLAPMLGAILSVVAGSWTAFWMFSGERVRGTSLHSWGPWVVLVLVAMAGAIFGRCVQVVAQLVDSRRWAPLLASALGLIIISAVLVRVDLTVYVSLYSHLHTSLEGGAALLSFIGITPLLARSVRQSALAAMWVNRAAAACAAVTLGFVLIVPLRSHVGEALRHAWREPVYVGRMLSRAQIVEGFVRDPRGWRGATMSSVVMLRERYDIATTARSPAWDQPLSEPPSVAKRIAALRGDHDYNVVFFYVDTLRADVARDPKVMPNAVQFAQEAIDFQKAYTTGSDTLHALPGLVGGTYDLFSEQPNDLVRVARSAGYQSLLVVARSAHEFLSRLLPGFHLDQTIEVSDYAAGNEEVWGYGADQPTAARITDRALEWLREHGRDQRFFLWLFNFDVHNWRELDEAYVRHVGKQYGLLDESDRAWKYRIVARSIDVQLARLLAGLKETSLDENTIVVLVSDHGEGLGRDGFWVHSVFLWEDLVHVPLIMKVPGIQPKIVKDVVSIVDVAPTIARYMASNAETRGYQGEDLLTYLVPDRPKRRLPLVLMSTLKEVPVRLGLIHPDSPFKLVLPLEGAVPELYDLRASDPDAVDVGPDNRQEMLRLLNELVRAPLFPRLDEAGSGPLDQAAKDGRTAIAVEAAQAEEARLKTVPSASAAAVSP